MEMGNTFGERMRFARKERGITQKALAETTGIHHRTVQGYEGDSIQPTIFMATCIADAMEVSLDWLAGRDEYCADMS